MIINAGGGIIPSVSRVVFGVIGRLYKLTLISAGFWEVVMLGGGSEPPGNIKSKIISTSWILIVIFLNVDAVAISKSHFFLKNKVKSGIS